MACARLIRYCKFPASMGAYHNHSELLFSVMQLWNHCGLLNYQKSWQPYRRTALADPSVFDVKLRSIWFMLCASRFRRGCLTRWRTCYLVRVDGLIAGSLRFFCCAQVLVLTLSFLVSFFCPDSCKSANSRCGCSSTSRRSVFLFFLLIVYIVQYPCLFHRWFALRLFVTFHVTRRCLFELFFSSP